MIDQEVVVEVEPEAFVRQVRADPRSLLRLGGKPAIMSTLLLLLALNGRGM